MSVELTTLWLMLKRKKIDCNRKVNADCFSHFIENLGQQSTQNICAPFIKQFLWKLQKNPWFCTHVLIIWNVDTGKRLRNDVVITLDNKICILSIVFSLFSSNVLKYLRNVVDWIFQRTKPSCLADPFHSSHVQLKYHADSFN